MRLAIVIPDGAADRPEDFPGGRTPLEEAATPETDALAREGVVGLAVTVPPEVKPGSDVANMSVLGLDPREHRVGRAALEARGRGVELEEGEVVFRANLVTVRDGVMEDYSAGGISSEEARPLVAGLAESLAPQGARLVAGVGYRHLLVLKDSGGLEAATTTPPHDIQGQALAAHLPRGPGAERLRGLMEAGGRWLAGSRANALWLWGQGRRASLPTLAERFGVRGAVISAVDLVRGIGRAMGMDVIEVPGATGDVDTDYAGKGAAAAEALGEHEVAFVHVEAPDEASHRGDATAKREAIERVDAEVVGRLRRRAGELRAEGAAVRVLVLPDHLTPLATRTHSHGAVPFALAGDGVEPGGAAAYSERAAAGTGVYRERGWEILSACLSGAWPGSRTQEVTR